MGPARLLDLTRSLRRAARGATGIDRVERAYLDRFLQDDVPVFGLMRTAFGYVVLDRAGMQAFADRLEGRAPWGAADLASRLPRGRNQSLMQAETAVRRLSVARSLPLRLRPMLQRLLPGGFDYYNVGHSNLTERVLVSVKSASGQVHVLIHDVIPLELPQLQRDGTVRPFREKVQRVRRLADRIIYNSQDTRARSEAVMAGWGPVPYGIVAHLGTIRPIPDPRAVPAGVRPEQPYFITVGTIEPRKNHGFLLDLWEEMGSAAPPLIICGSRGWKNDAVFERLDNLPADSPVTEVSGLNDAALAALVQHSAGLLFPSLSEGFGLPPVEALHLGTRVLCNDLAVLHEILGKNANFVPVSDRDLWIKTIKNWQVTTPQAGRSIGFAGPEWADHFKTVLRLR